MEHPVEDPVDEDRTFSTGEAASLLDLTPEEVRGFARAGLSDPERGDRNEYRFRFRDLVVLRMAARLRRARVSARRIERAFIRLRGRQDASVAGLHLEALGSHVVVRDGEIVWRADSDQLQLVLEPSAPAPASAGSPTPCGPSAGGAADEAAVLAERASRAEASDPARALELYERALRTDPACWEALVGAGFLRQRAGDVPGAVEAYERALALEDDATVAYNLGVALDDLGRAEEAAAAYRATLDLDPALTDAHFNLALLYEKLGDRRGALRHMIAYRELTRPD